MKFASFQSATGQGYGIVQDGRLLPAASDFLDEYPGLRDVIAAGAHELLRERGVTRSRALPLHKIDLLPPIPSPGKIICAGMNYPKPSPVAAAAPAPGNIIIFGRHEESFTGHGAPLEMPLGEAAKTFDYEGEIAVVIGKPGRHIATDDAAAHVFGYAAMNEGSVRGWQKHCLHAGKNFAASGSWGPWIVTADEIAEPGAMMLSTWLNGERMQHACVREMIHSPAELIAHISHVMPLGPGDVIATGSPDGTGGSRKPPLFLRRGDVVEIEVSGVGRLHNRVGA